MLNICDLFDTIDICIKFNVTSCILFLLTDHPRLRVVSGAVRAHVVIEGDKAEVAAEAATVRVSRGPDHGVNRRQGVSPVPATLPALVTGPSPEIQSRVSVLRNSEGKNRERGLMIPEVL